MNKWGAVKLYGLVLVLVMSMLVAVVAPSIFQNGFQDEGSPTLTTISAEKAANGFWNQRVDYVWTVEKTVSDEAIALKPGESAVLEYEIEIVRTAEIASDVFGVFGGVYVINAGQEPTEGLTIVDTVYYSLNGGESYDELINGTVDTSAKPVLQPGESFNYAYTIPFDPVDGALYLNTALVSITNTAAQSIYSTDEFDLPTTPTIIHESDLGAQLSDIFDVPTGWSIVISDEGPWALAGSDTVTFNVTVTNDNAPVGSTRELVNTASLLELDTQTVRTSTVTVDLISVGSASINVTKTGPKCAWEGKTVVYTITVENDGEVDLTSVVVIDQMVGFLENVPNLPVGAIVSWNVEFVIPDLPPCQTMFCNIATATGWYYVDGEPVEFVFDEAQWCLRIWHPGMDIQKWTDYELMPEGHEITYYYTVFNTGDSPLFDVRVYDDKLGMFYKADEGGNGTLLSGDTWSFSTTTTIPVTEDIRLWTLCNVATAYGDICDGTWSVSTEWCVEIIDPRIEVTKWSPYDMIVEDHTIPYFINVTNTGNYPLESVYVDDSMFGIINYEENDGILQPGETWYIELKYYLGVDSGLEELCNEVTAYGLVCHAWITDSAEWCIDIVHPCIEVTKWAPYEMLTEGHTVTYYINVTNCGDVDLENVRVYDDMMNMTFCLVDYQDDGTLAPGETWYLEVEYTIPLTEVREPYYICNVVTAYGDICHAYVESSAKWCIQIVHPMISIEKCCEYDMLLEGHMQEFKICVTNTGDVALENVCVYDELLDKTFYLADEVDEDGTLGVGESWCFEFSWEVPMTTLNEQYTIVNTATAFGDLCHGTVNDTNSCSFVIVHPCIDVEKTADYDMIIEGHTITYTVVVTNCGDVALDDVKVYDDLLDMWFYYDAPVVDGEPLCPPPIQTGDTLNPGENWTFSYEYTVPTTDMIEPWMLCNNVTAYGWLCHMYVTDTDRVCIEIVHPSIEVTKWSPFTMAIEGHEVYWLVNVTNTGDVALDLVQVWDTLTEQWYTYDANANGTLLPGETWSFTITYTVPETDINEPWCLCNEVYAQGYLCHDWVLSSARWCIQIVHPCIDIQKTVDYDMIIEGHSVIWTITVTNCGDVALENVRVYDELIDTWFLMGGEVPTISIVPSDVLLPGQVWQFSFCYVIPETDLNEQYRICNNATVYADICHVTLNDTATACVTVVHPCIEVTKWSPFTMAVEGHEVYWIINVTNCGDVALDDVKVYDELLNMWFYYDAPVIEGAPLCCPPIQTGDTLNPGETWSFIVNYTVPYTDCKEPWCLCNEATAYGSICHAVLEDSARSCIRIVHPEISVEKCCEPGVAVEGHPVNFTVVVTNTGDVALDNVYFYDDVLNTTYYLADYQMDGTLAPGESWTVVIPWVIPYTDLNEQYCIRNVATAYGQLCHAWYSDKDCCCINVVHPSIEIVKWSPYVMIVEDHCIPYYLNVTNTGDVGLANVRVYDTMFGWLYLYDMVKDSDGILMPGEWWNITLWYYVEPTDLNEPYEICNMATVYGDLCHATYTDFDCWCIMVYHPSIDIVKTADTGIAVEGHPVTYTITVTNTGDSMLHNVSVYDSMFGWFCLDKMQVDGTLNPGEVWQFNISYVIPDESPCPEIWEVYNTATVYGDFCHATLTDEDCWYIQVVHPAIDIEKEVNCCSAEAGDTVTYYFYVTNTGDIELNNVTIEDERIGFDYTIGYLAVGQTVSVKTDWVVTCDITEDPFCNRAVVRGYVVTQWNCHEVMVSDCDCARLDIIHPRLTILKFGPDQAAIGDIVLFSIYVQNTGDVPLSDIRIVDGCFEWCIRSLDIGQEKFYLVPFIITGCMPDPFVNVACGSGWYYDCPCDEMREVKASGEWTVDIIHPSIDLDKSAPATADAGTCIEYTFTVTNTGDVPLTGVVIEDEMLGLRIFIGDLCVGENKTVKACYELPEYAVLADSKVVILECCEPGDGGDDGWYLENKAVVTGFYLGWKVCDKDSAITEIIPPECMPR